MTQSTKLRLFNSFKGEQKKPNNVQGWLMNVQTYRNSEESVLTDENNKSIPVSRKNRAGSFASEESVNLEELINANFTTDMDDETALPDLADLDLDDSTDEFWKLEKSETMNTLNTSFTSKPIHELDWSPTDNHANHLKTSLPVTPSSERSTVFNRSGSISSENSLTSQSTMTQYAKYGFTPITNPSESSSASSRSLSRQSNYSTASSTTASHLRKNSGTHISTGIPTPSRSSTYKRDTTKGSTQRTRASHIPAPALSPPTPQRTISTSSTNKQTQKRIPQRASHIPTVREATHRPGSPLQQRMRSPTPGSPRNSLFPSQEEKATRLSGLRPPGTSSRSPSRIGTLKRTL